ncbi:MAG: ArsA-related P-loop ATPase [Thermodesulfobacteriota bacterium]
MAAPRLVIVTGKGGVGKTTVAAGVARAAVAARRRALLVEIATPGKLASVLDVPALAAEPRVVAEGLAAVALDEGRALEELVHGLMPLRLLSRRLLSSETFRVVAAAVPGILQAALLAQVVSWLEERDRRGRPRYDVVVLDSPASGHSVPLLATPRTLSGLATVGPLGEVMRRTSRWLGDPELTRALVVAIPEDWAVAEAVELYESLRDGLAIPVGRPLLNAVFPRRFSRTEEALLEEAEAGHTVDPELLASGRYFVERRRAALAHGKVLREETRARPLELPFLFARGMTWDDLDPIADAIAPALA